MDHEQALQARNRELELALRQAQERLTRHFHESGLLRQLERELGAVEDLTAIVEYALRWISNRIPVAHAVVACWLPERNSFEVVGGFGKPLGLYIEPKQHIELPREMMPKAQRHVSESEILWDQTGNALAVDLRRPSGELMGVMVLQYGNAEHNFSATEHFVRHCADRLETAMHHAIMVEKFRELSLYRAQLFRMLSHDLRQPLTVLMGFVQLARFSYDKGSYEVIGSHLENIEKGAKDVQKLLEEVLLKEQIDNSSRDDWEIFSMRDACKQVIEKHLQLAEWKSHEIQLEITEEAALCEGLALQLKEATSNLISNAIKYTPDGGRIKIALWTVPERIYFEVVDSGYGISKARQAKLFQPFYRAQEPGTEYIKGTGLGLNLVKGIIENHNGEVYFSSESGQGSTFGFWLPAAPKRKE